MRALDDGRITRSAVPCTASTGHARIRSSSSYDALRANIPRRTRAGTCAAVAASAIRSSSGRAAAPHSARNARVAASRSSSASASIPRVWASMAGPSHGRDGFPTAIDAPTNTTPPIRGAPRCRR